MQAACSAHLMRTEHTVMHDYQSDGRQPPACDSCSDALSKLVLTYHRPPVNSTPKMIRGACLAPVRRRLLLIMELTVRQKLPLIAGGDLHARRQWQLWEGRPPGLALVQSHSCSRAVSTQQNSALDSLHISDLANAHCGLMVCRAARIDDFQQVLLTRCAAAAECEQASNQSHGRGCTRACVLGTLF